VRVAWDRESALANSLTLVLRSYPFDKPPKGPVTIKVVPDLTNNHLTSTEPIACMIEYVGREDRTTGIGTVATHHLRVIPGNKADEAGDYWFASESGAPWLNILIAYRGPAGITYALKSNRRWAYWERP
jgi:hypothetical protein